MYINGEKLKVKRYSSGELRLLRSELNSHVKNNEVDKVIAVSQSSKKELLELGCFEDEKQIDVIYNILDTEKIKEGAKEKLDKPLGKDINFVTVSRIAPIKRFDRIEKFVQILEQKQIDFKWFIIGKANEYEKE